MDSSNSERDNKPRGVSLTAAFGMTLAAVALAAVVRWLLDPLLGEQVPFATFVVAVVVASWFGGLWPALLAALLGILLSWYLFVPPRYSFAIPPSPHLIGLAMYGLVGLAVAAFGESQRHSRQTERLERQQERGFAGAGEVRLPDPRLRDLTVFGFGLTLSVLVIGGALGYMNVRRLSENERIVANTHVAIAELEALLSTLKDAETGQRGYLLTEDEKYLQPYEDAMRRVEASIKRFEKLTSDDAEQQARFAVLETKIVGRMDELMRTVDLTKDGDRLAAMKIVRSGAGKAMMDDLRDEVAAIEEVERISLRRRALESEESYRTTVSSILFPALIGALLLASVFYLSRRNLLLRHRSAKVLGEQRERLRVTLASIGDAVITTDAGGHVAFLNAVAQELTGWTQDDALGKPLDVVFNILNEQTRAPVENPVRKVLEEGRVVGLANHTVLVSKDGTERPIDDSAAPIRDAKGRIGGVVLVFHDITLRKQAEESLRQAEQQFRVMADNIPQLAWMANPDGNIYWYNRRWYEYTGTTLEQMTGWGWQSVHDPLELPKVMERWKASLATGERFDMVFPLKGRDGVFRPFLTRVEPVKDNVGRVVQWFGTNTDITEQQNLERALQEADRRKDEFLATLAHELRNPLAPLRNGLQLMRLADGQMETVEHARAMMERQLAQLVRLVDDLMDVSRISRGRLELRKERVQLATVLNSAIETSRPLIEELGHKLIVSLPEQPIVLDADLTRLAQVFLNLLNNAAKYSDRGGRIRLTAGRQGSDVVVSVKDNGIGIDPAHLSGIFEMFSQVNRSLEKSQGGLGIGLTLVKRLVEMHGGRIEPRSEGLGKGSEFVVRLPLVIEESGPASDVRDETAAVKTSLRVLIVDDNRDGADSLAMMLRLNGNDVCTAYDGQEGLDVAGAFRPDVLVLDIGMPKLNGYEVCRHIREQTWGKRPVIIALTGWGQDEDRRRSREAGFDHHLVKPVDPGALLQLLAGLSGTAKK